MEMINLTGEWKLRGEFLDVGAENFFQVASRKEGKFTLPKENQLNRMPSREGFMTAIVPCDVITPLVENDLISEPLLKKNTKECMWIGNYSWWFIKEFETSAKMLENDEVRLFIEMLDYNAHIILNGRILANHKNTFRAFEKDVKRFLNEGKNQIIIRLTTGYEEHYPHDSLSFYCNSKFAQRLYLRKPQFTHGWDWCKPVPTCGIGGRVYLEGVSGANICFFRCDTLDIGDARAVLNFAFEIENLSMCTADDAVLQVEMRCGGETAVSFSKALYLAGGVNFINEEVTLNDPKLWFPNGYGGQPLYTVSASVTCRGVTRGMPEKKVGIRIIRINQEKLPDGSRKFVFVVNGVEVFCKGGNWVPADSAYLRITKEKYRALVEEAAECNFTMLRIWGGGMYEPDCFYDCCSEKGILVMQDFMYACAFYPDYNERFMREASLEAEYQTKRLAHQACLAVWTGNNEVHESYTDWYKEQFTPEYYYGTKIFNYMLPGIVKSYSPLVHYMPSSPFYGNKANDLFSGDCHVWNWTRLPHDTGFKFVYELEALDRIAEKVRFSSEYGFYGALMKSSVERFHDGEEVVLLSDTWIHHGEHDEKRQWIISSMKRHLTDPKDLDADGYLLYSGIMQGILYDEFTLALRLRSHCSGQLIWMYNDCWPETGWTIIDYYLTRKVSFYFLKRAFETRKLIVKQIGDMVRMAAVNETPETLDMSVEYGFMDFNGVKRGVVTEQISLAPHTRFDWETFSAAYDLANGFYYMISSDKRVKPVVGMRGYYRDVPFGEADIKVMCSEIVDGNRKIKIRSDRFAPVVYIKTADDKVKMDDNFFSLIPGCDKEVTLYNYTEEPQISGVNFQ